MKWPWCWERLKAGGEGDDRGWDGWLAPPTQWTWIWVNSGSWWWTGRPGVLWFMGSQRVRHNLATEMNCIGFKISRYKSLIRYMFAGYFLPMWYMFINFPSVIFLKHKNFHFSFMVLLSDSHQRNHYPVLCEDILLCFLL